MPRRVWTKYVHENRTEGDCQLVTAINAYYHLTGKTVSDVDYQKYIDLSGCRHGSAVSIEKVWRKLGIKILWQGVSLYSLLNSSKDWTPKKGFVKIQKNRLPLPIEINVWHKKCGFHSVLIVDHCIKTQCVRITNFPWETSSEGWMFEEDLYKFTRVGNAGYWCFRLFGLKGQTRRKTKLRK